MAGDRASSFSLAPPSYASRPSTLIAEHRFLTPRDVSPPEMTHTAQSTPSEPVILNWTPPDLHGEPNRAVESQLRALQSTIVASTQDAEVAALPPRYEDARVPTIPITYSFSPSSPNSMVLVPPADAADSRPIFHIFVHMNCFIPSSYITTVRRGGTEHSPEVGSFEMGARVDTVYIRGIDRDRDKILSLIKHRKHKVEYWKWQCDDVHIQWYCMTTPYTCKFKGTDVELARFTPTGGRRHPHRPAQLDTLDVLPKGQKHIDDILISILVIERIRRAPPPP